jgi:DNA-binding transcriptional LysR family regulator
MDRFLAMQVFMRVVEQGSFAKAAERLGISTSACSRHVAELEAHLNARLLNRTTRRLSLTESGQAFYERCVQVLADLEEAEQAAAVSAVLPRGTLKVTCGISFGVAHVPGLIGAFTARHPEVKFDVQLSDRFVDLVEEGFDLAIRIGESPQQNLIARKLGETRLVPCAAPIYLREHGAPETPADLVRHACLTYEYLPQRNMWRFRDQAGSEQAVRVAGPLHANNGEMLVAAAVEGLGIAMEPDFIVAGHLAARRLVRILEDFAPAPTSIYAVYPSRRHLSAKVRAFVGFLAERFAHAGDWTANRP